MPVRWEILSPKALFEERRTINFPEDVHLTPSQKYGVLPQSEYVERTGGSVVLNLAGQDKMKHVEEGDFIIHLRSFQGGLERAHQSGKVSSAYTVIAPKLLADPGYYGWVLKSSAYIQELQTTTNQLRDGQSIRWSDFVKVPLPNPPLNEQQAIADYLDREMRRIDELIAEQRGLIETLRERRRAVIAEASTRGVDSGASLVDTGISWVGKSPSHWVRSRHSAVLGEVKRVVGESASEATLLSLTRRGVTPRDLSENRGKFPASFDLYQWVEPGQLIFCLFDMDETPRTVGLALQRGMITGAYDVFSVNALAAEPAFLEYYFIGIDDEKRFRPLYTGLRKVIQKPRFKAAPIVLPPVTEQREIVAYLDDQTSRIDALIAESEDLIALSQERRAALITAAVTGQIDVRSAA